MAQCDSEMTYGDYTYPEWSIGLGWALAMVSFILIPIWIIPGICKAKGRNCWQVK